MHTDVPAAGDIASALAELEPLLSADRRATVMRLRARLTANQFRTLVVGEAKRGKSTLVNALIGRAVLPAGVLPVTALVTTLAGGSPERVVVDYTDGRREEHPLLAVADFVTEPRNPRNHKGVASVLVVIDTPLLPSGLQLVDTPGTGSIFEHNTRAAERGLDDVDAAIFLLSADPPISEAETMLLDIVWERAQFVLFVLNKIDYLAPDDVRQVHDFTVRAVTNHVGEPIELWECSATAALAARQANDEQGFRASGMAAFDDVFRERLAAMRDTALPNSITQHALRLLHAELDDAELARRVLQLRTTHEQHRVDEFTRSLNIAAHRRDNLRTLVEAGRRSISKSLTDDSELFNRRLQEEALSAMHEFVGEPAQASASPGDLERAGHARAGVVIRAAIEAWRLEQKTVIEEALATLVSSVEGDVARQLDSIRSAADELLNVRLSLGHEAPTVPTTTRFNFDFSEDAGPTELLAGALRRRLPARIGRRRAFAWLDRDVRDLVDRHVGRARADLDDRLRAACRHLAASATDEFGSIVLSLRKTIDTTLASAAADVDRSAERARLDEVTAGLRRVNTKLSAAHRPASTTHEPRRLP